MDFDIKSCRLCPRDCGADRTVGKGFCGTACDTDTVVAAKAMLHQWEEPPLSGKTGSGAVFFSGCNMKCCYCQNSEISVKSSGKTISTDRLASIFLELQENGACNINLVTPTHFVPQIINALDKVKDRLEIPVVYNCGGYEKTEIIKKLDGYVDIFLPDIKYYDDALAVRYSSAQAYFECALEALKQMIKQTNGISYDSGGNMTRGVIVRHLVLPGAYRDSIRILGKLSELEKSKFLVSLMCQFTPCHKCFDFPEINRRLTTFEYRKVRDKCIELGFDGFFQEKSSASSEYTPDFDLSGI